MSAIMQCVRTRTICSFPSRFWGALSNIANIELLVELTSRMQETWTTPNVHGKAGVRTSYKPL